MSSGKRELEATLKGVCLLSVSTCTYIARSNIGYVSRPRTSEAKYEQEKFELAEMENFLLSCMDMP